MADTVAAGETTAPRTDERAGEAAWDHWAMPPPRPDMPVLHLDGFDGPMDLLLELAQRQRIDLGRMSMLALAEQFAAALERLAGRVPVACRAEWLVLASRLVLLRSRLILPASAEAAAEAERDAAAELRRLDALARGRGAAAWLQTRPALGQDVFVRPSRRDPRIESYMALMEACLVVLRGRAGRPDAGCAYQPVVPELWRVADALARVRTLLAEHPEGGVLAGFLPPCPDEPYHGIKARAAVASTLLAGLELGRDGQAWLQQDEAFGAIHIQATSQATSAERPCCMDTSQLFQ
jgi:segregation and condensation protein A